MNNPAPFGQLRSQPREPSARIAARDGESVTLSDCGIALDEIDHELNKLLIQSKEIDRRTEALKTQAKMIRMIARQLSGF